MTSLFGKKPISPEETAVIVRASAIKRGVDLAQSQIVGILGRRKGFTKVHVGLTDIDLGKTPQDRQGYAVVTIFTGASEPTVSGVRDTIATWLKACHGDRYESTVAKPPVKPGTKSVYLAIS